MPNDRWLSRTPDGSWAVLVRPLPAVTGLALLVAGLGLALMAQTGQVWIRGAADSIWLALMVIGVTTVLAIGRTTAFAALLAAATVIVFCWGLDFEHTNGQTPDFRLPWPPHLIATVGLVSLAGTLGMLGAFRAKRRAWLAVGCGALAMGLAGTGIVR